MDWSVEHCNECLRFLRHFQWSGHRSLLILYPSTFLPIIPPICVFSSQSSHPFSLWMSGVDVALRTNLHLYLQQQYNETITTSIYDWHFEQVWFSRGNDTLNIIIWHKKILDNNSNTEHDFQNVEDLVNDRQDREDTVEEVVVAVGLSSSFQELDVLQMVSNQTTVWGQCQEDDHFEDRCILSGMSNNLARHLKKQRRET